MPEKTQRTEPQWLCRGLTLKTGHTPLVMGILNVTPDSFSDGGSFFSPDAAIEQGLKMIQEGAAIIDIGGESTRPGAAPVDAAEEENRIIPVIKAIARQSKAVISVDTTKARVAAAALDAGAQIINDISACTFDSAMPAIAAQSGAGIILMHMKGTPRTMQSNPHYENVTREVRDYLVAQTNVLMLNGVKKSCVAIDPGIGFGKTLEHNLRLLAELNQLMNTGVPVVVGLSRKSFMKLLIGREVRDRLAGSIAGAVFCALKGAHVLRVHDVRETVDAMRVVNEILKME